MAEETEDKCKLRHKEAKSFIPTYTGGLKKRLGGIKKNLIENIKSTVQ